MEFLLDLLGYAIFCAMAVVFFVVLPRNAITRFGWLTNEEKARFRRWCRYLVPSVFVLWFALRLRRDRTPQS